MTFTTALLSSFTLTTSVLYLTVLHHRRTRLQQAELLNQQTLLLNSLISPKLASDLATIREENFSGFAGREKIWPFSLYDTRRRTSAAANRERIGLGDLVEPSTSSGGQNEKKNAEGERDASKANGNVKDVESEAVVIRLGPDEYVALSRPWQERWKDGWNREIGAGYGWVFGGGLRTAWEDIRGNMMSRLERRRQQAAAAVEK